MAQSKKELIEAATAAGIEVPAKATISDIQALLDNKSSEQPEVSEVIVEEQTKEVIEETEESKTVAKAGKRSAKALAEAEEKQLKEERKESKAEDEAEKPRAVAPPTRTRLERRGKQFRKSAEQIKPDTFYNVNDAVALAKKTSHVKFDATVELHINLGVDPRHADQNIRDNVILPAGSGKKIRIAVLTDDAAEAKAAGADIAGTDDLLAVLDKGTIDFDILISTPANMAKLGKYARMLGPRGLMPNPKSGTVTPDLAGAVKDAKGGKVEFRIDKQAIIHQVMGKVSFTPQKLEENARTLLSAILKAKPSAAKGTYVRGLSLTTTMGPSIKIDAPATISAISTKK